MTENLNKNKQTNEVNNMENKNNEEVQEAKVIKRDDNDSVTLDNLSDDEIQALKDENVNVDVLRSKSQQIQSYHHDDYNTKTGGIQPVEHTQDQLDEYKRSLDVSDVKSVTYYGAEAQREMSSISKNILDESENYDRNAKPIIKNIDNILQRIEDVDIDKLNPENQNFFKRIFTNTKELTRKMKHKAINANSEITKLSVQLENNSQDLMNDVIKLDDLFNATAQYYNDLTGYIKAGEQRMQELREHDLKDAQEQARNSNDPVYKQRVDDIEQYITRLDKQIMNLRTSQMLALQTAPQIRMIQNVNVALADKVQNSVVTAVPLFQNQLAIAFSLQRQSDLLQIQDKLETTINGMIVENAEKTSKQAVKVAEQNERPLVQYQALKKRQDLLNKGRQDVARVTQQGLRERETNKKEIMKLEKELLQNNQDLLDEEKSRQSYKRNPRELPEGQKRNVELEKLNQKQQEPEHVTAEYVNIKNVDEQPQDAYKQSREDE